MRILLFFTFLGSFVLGGCATPGATVLLLDYQKPVSPQKIDTAIISRLSIPISKAVDFKTVKAPPTDKQSPPGSGHARPVVKKADSWSIVLSRVYLADADLSWYEGAPNIAVLLRIRSGDKSDIDGKWVLAAVQTDVAVKSALNFDNLVVWSGTSKTGVVIDVQLLKLNKADKARLSGYLSAAKNASNAIPQYGPIAAAIIQAADAINKSRDDYTVVLDYSAGFHPESELRYATYAVLLQEVANKDGSGLWYSISPGANKDYVMLNDSHLLSNWCALRVIKGSSSTFDYGREKSLADVRSLADTWVNQINPVLSFDNLNTAVRDLVSVSESKRLTSEIDFRDAKSVYKGLVQLKSNRTNPKLKLKDEDYQSILNLTATYLPEDLIPKPEASIEAWIAVAQKLVNENFKYDRSIERFSK